MEPTDYSKLSDDALLAKKKELKKSQLFYAIFIGFLGGVFGFGMISWMLNPDKKIGLLIPMLIPVVFIYKLIKKNKDNQPLIEALKERGLDK